MKQLLLSQWMSGANPLESTALSGASGQDAGGDLFQLLLSQFMESTSGTDTLPALTAVPSAVIAAPAAAVNPLGTGADRLAMDNGSSSAYDGLISATAAKYGLSPALIKGVMEVESSFNAGAVSTSGAKGLMQLMDDTARGLGVTDSFDPAQNVDGGARFLSYLLRKYDGNVSSALAAYNAGPGRVDRLGLTTDEQIRARLGELPKETQRYVVKVLEAAHRWGLQG
ncbi:lytic transglycosylase domain-containing protein [Cohnella pontilimi]|uniref:Lytic transglycosylase domain-containing protein n=2 Tax=Cohnella pontilimi TaxID=2564100 RepID=A0A4V5LSM2_9BACL|nr:lytic transglycosylase domain-containing protein [Cohnella pontilimi]